MPSLKISDDAIDKNTIEVGDCTHPAGHCYGSDGGSGIPDNLKVPTGRGGEFRVQKLSLDRETLLEDAYYNKCQFCGKYSYVESKEERDKRQNGEAI